MKITNLLIIGAFAFLFVFFNGCREFPPSNNQEDNDITINNTNHIDVGLPSDNSSENTDIDLSNDSESDSQSDAESDSESKSSSDNSTSSRTKAGYRITNFNNITVYDFNMRK